MLYFILFWTLLMSQPNPAAKWKCDASTVNSICFQSDKFNSKVTNRIKFVDASVANVFVSYTDSGKDLPLMTHVLVTFSVSRSSTTKTFPLGTFQGIYDNPDDPRLEDFVWYDMEHGDFYIATYKNGKILKFTTHSTGNNTGLECLCD